MPESHSVATAANDPGRCRCHNDEGSTGLTFVEMMFAVAIGDTATKAALIFQTLQSAKVGIRTVWWELTPSVAHLFLTIFVIAASWVGWSTTKSTNHYMRKLKGASPPDSLWPLSQPFVMLLIDVALVVLYFVLAESIDVPKIENKALVWNYSALPEAKILFLIVLGYILWNLLNCWFPPKETDKKTAQQPDRRKLRLIFQLAALMLVWFAYSNSSSRATDIPYILRVDVSLLLAVIVFRTRVAKSTNAYLQNDIVRGVILLIVGILLL